MNIQLSDHFTYKKLLRFCMSPVIMMIFTSIYTVVDGFFISNYVGKVSFASVNLIMPPINIIGAFGFMVGTGGSALVGMTLGQGKRDKANGYLTMLVKFTAIFGTLCSIVGIFLIRPLAIALGATETMLPECVLYGTIMMAFNPAFMLQYVFQTLFPTAEKPKLGLAVTMISGITNMVLDALFVAAFKWGVVGAAFATGISQCVGGLFPILYFMRPNSSLLRFKKVKIEVRAILRICSNGASEFVSNISGAVVSMLFNFQLLRFAGENGVAAYGTIMYIQFIFIAIFLGYTMGTAPVISFHYGAGNHKELRSLLHKSIVLVGIAGIGMMTAAILFARPLAGIFVGYDAELLEMTSHALRLFAASFVFAGVNIFASSFFTALSNGGVSAAISFSRTLVFQSLSILILPIFFGLDGVWWTMSVAEVLAVLVSITFILLNKKKYHY